MSRPGCPRRGLALLTVLGLALAAVAHAQDAPAPATRAEALEALRAARTVEPVTRPLLERALIYVEEKRIVERLNPPEGFYPLVGSVARGSGWGVGAGYRRRPLDGRLRVDTSAAITFRNYQTAQFTVSAPRLAGRPIELSTGTRWYDYPQEDFFGLGRQSNVDDRVSFTLRGLDVFGQAAARRAGGFVTRARAGVHRYETGRGRDAKYPTAGDLFTEATAPGLTEAPTLAYAEGAVGIDTRDEPGNTRSGGLYTVGVGLFRDRRGDFDFNRIDVTLLHVIPIFDKKRGITLHAAASRIAPVAGGRVPFFLMPTVGGSDSLRGYRDFRFRDAAAVVLNAEYRWEAFSGLDLALFVDAADVGPTWRSLVGADLRSSWGLGFRFNTNRRVFLRLDAAGGREGARLWVAMGPSFRR
ncbi:MAG: BamA/TamA family outer membrane protein [Vicinamibacterales bacterium]